MNYSGVRSVMLPFAAQNMSWPMRVDPDDGIRQFSRKGISFLALAGLPDGAPILGVLYLKACVLHFSYVCAGYDIGQARGA
jgi:hypothetical protein